MVPLIGTPAPRCRRSPILMWCRASEPRAPARPVTDDQEGRRGAILSAHPAGRRAGTRPDRRPGDRGRRRGGASHALPLLPSKHHVFAAVLTEQVSRFRPPPPTGDAVADISALMVAACRNLLRQRHAACDDHLDPDRARAGHAPDDPTLRELIMATAGLDRPTTEQVRRARLVQQAAFGIMTWTIGERSSPTTPSPTSRPPAGYCSPARSEFGACRSGLGAPGPVLRGKPEGVSDSLFDVPGGNDRPGTAVPSSAPAGRADAPGHHRRGRRPGPPAAPGSPLRRLVEGSGAASVILYGPPGTGKTTLASLISPGDRASLKPSRRSRPGSRRCGPSSTTPVGRPPTASRPCCSSTRCTGSPRPAGRAAGRRGEPRRAAGGRHHREPVLLRGGAAAVAVADPATAATDPDAVRTLVQRAVTDPRGWPGRRRPSRTPSSCWCSCRPAMPAAH